MKIVTQTIKELSTKFTNLKNVRMKLTNIGMRIELSNYKAHRLGWLG